MAINKFPNTVAGKAEARAALGPKYITEGAEITVFTGDDIPSNEVDAQQHAADRYVTAEQFRDRFTDAELLAISEAGQTDKMVAFFLTKLGTTSEQFSLDRQDVIDGLNYIVSKGLLNSNRPAKIRE